MLERPSRDVFANGLRVLTQPIPHVHSVATGVWAGVGAAHEPAKWGGISHFVEHMLFKGTEKRDALAIAEEMESVGGCMNAFTGREYTCYYTRSIDEHFDLSLDLLSDMYLHSIFDPKEFAREKDVIIEEINMYEDAPDDLVQDLFTATLWRGHAYGRPVIGTKHGGYGGRQCLSGAGAGGGREILPLQNSQPPNRKLWPGPLYVGAGLYQKGYRANPYLPGLAHI